MVLCREKAKEKVERGGFNERIILEKVIVDCIASY